MDVQITSLSAPTPVGSAAPNYVADLRPSADIAALARDPRPEIPMALPASTAQAAIVNRNLLDTPQKGSELARTSVTPPIEALARTLKPYGVSMLPNRENL